MLISKSQEVGFLPKKVLNRIVQKAAPLVAKALPEFSMSSLKRPLFILGCARSGTTLLARLLDMHMDIANWTEANEIWDPYWYPWHEGNLDNRYPIEYNPEAFTQRWWQENKSRIEQIKAIFGAYQYLRQKPVFMNKTPYHIFRLPFLRSHFPHAHYIYIVRDGRAIVHSYMEKLYKEDKLREWPEHERQLFKESKPAFAESLGSYWKRTIEEVEKQKESLKLEKDGRLFCTSYEELCDNTPKVLEQVCSFIGISSDRFISEPEKQNIQNTNHKWQDKLDDETIQRMVVAMEPKLTEYGYQN